MFVAIDPEIESCRKALQLFRYEHAVASALRLFWGLNVSSLNTLNILFLSLLAVAFANAVDFLTRPMWARCLLTALHSWLTELCFVVEVF